MVKCLEVTLLAPLFPEHHKEKWPGTHRNPDTTNLSDKYSKKIYSVKIDRYLWAIRCMEGVFRTFMKTKSVSDNQILQT